MNEAAGDREIERDRDREALPLAGGYRNSSAMVFDFSICLHDTAEEALTHPDPLSPRSRSIRSLPVLT